MERDGGRVLHVVDVDNENVGDVPLRFLTDQEGDGPVPIPSQSRGHGREVAKQNYEHPTNDPETIPIPTDEDGTGVVFQGFEVDPGLTKVTAYAIEEAAVLDPVYDYTGDWKVVAFATCALPGVFRRTGAEKHQRQGRRLV